ncbi:MerR family transcriptional regulator [Micromonospora sp. NPDC049204]|uniref:MerR family transcriptional regulator n=1 Tax=unclassified Micromonospora TaxID=2617518 RepID=UPI0033C43809
MLSISDFSEMCHLSPQTLRFYHSEGLLVPAAVSEQTGYRSYTFDQVERAMLITVLRGTGMSVKLVRRALDEPDTAAALLEAHSGDVQRQRQTQDEAIRDAREFLSSWPEVHLRHAPEMTVVSTLVAGRPAGHDRSEWDESEAVATVQEVVKTVESCGAVVAGVPWRTPAIETPEQKRQSSSGGGPWWLVKVPVTADAGAVAALSRVVEVQAFDARDELSIFIPGRTTMAKYATALSRLLTHPLDGAFPDLSRTRHLLHDDGVETRVAICTLDETDAGQVT